MKSPSPLLVAALAFLACRSATPAPDYTGPAHVVKPTTLEYDPRPVNAGVVDLTPQMVYEKARRFERRDRYPEAIATYERLVAQSPGYLDAGERRAALLELVEMAEVLYADAMKADSDEEARQSLELIRQFWPGYRDVPQLLAKK
jgi:hypothetical protein